MIKTLLLDTLLLFSFLTAHLVRDLAHTRLDEPGPAGQDERVLVPDPGRGGGGSAAAAAAAAALGSVSAGWASEKVCSVCSSGRATARR